MRKLLSFMMAGLCGAVVADLFLRLYGIVIACLTKFGAMAWINFLPKNIRVFGFYFHSFFFEALTMAIVVAIIGGIFGVFLRIDFKVASVVSFSGFFITKCLYGYRFFGDFSFLNSPLIYLVLMSVVSILFFWGSFLIGGHFVKKAR